MAQFPNGTPYTGSASGIWNMKDIRNALMGSNWPIGVSIPRVLSVRGAAGFESASISCTVINGGYPITEYTVTSIPESITATGSSLPIIVTGLTNGTEYTFTVVATNEIGDSLPSAESNPVTPTDNPYISWLLFYDFDIALNGLYTNPMDSTTTPQHRTQRNGISKFGTGAMYPEGGLDYRYVEPTVDTSAITGNYTIDAWVMISLGVWEGYTTLMNLDQPGYFGKGRWGFAGDGSDWRLYYAPAAGELGIVGTQIVPQDAEFHHVAFFRQGGVSYFAVDGVVETYDPTGVEPVFDATSIQVGGDDIGNYMPGYVDNFRLINACIFDPAGFTPPVVTDYPASSNLYPGWLVFYNFDDYTDDIYTNIIDGGTTPTNGNAETGVSKFGTGALQPDIGSPNWIDVFKNVIVVTGDYTIDAWVMIPNNGVGDIGSVLMNLSAWSSYGKGHWGIIGNDDSKVLFYGPGGPYPSGSQGDPIMGTIPFPQDDEFHHVAFFRQSGVSYFAVDGVVETYDPTGFDPVFDQESFQVGGADWSGAAIGTTPYGPINGYVDNFRLINACIFDPAGFTPPVVTDYPT